MVSSLRNHAIRAVHCADSADCNAGTKPERSLFPSIVLKVKAAGSCQRHFAAKSTRAGDPAAHSPHPAAVRMVQESPLADLNGPTSKTANTSDGAVHGNQVGAGRVPCALRQALANTCRWKLARQQLAPELKVAATTFASNFLLAFNIRAGIGALLRVLQLLRTRYVQWHLGSVLLRSQWLCTAHHLCSA